MTMERSEYYPQAQATLSADTDTVQFDIENNTASPIGGTEQRVQLTQVDRDPTSGSGQFYLEVIEDGEVLLGASIQVAYGAELRSGDYILEALGMDPEDQAEPEFDVLRGKRTAFGPIQVARVGEVAQDGGELYPYLK